MGAMAARPRLTTPGGEGFSSEALSPPPPLANFAHFLERKTQRPHTPAPKPLPTADLQPAQKMGEPIPRRGRHTCHTQGRPSLVRIAQNDRNHCMGGGRHAQPACSPFSSLSFHQQTFNSYLTARHGLPDANVFVAKAGK